MRRRTPIFLVFLLVQLIAGCVDVATPQQPAATRPPGATSTPASPTRATPSAAAAETPALAPASSQPGPTDPTATPPGSAASLPVGRYLCYLVPSYTYSGYVDLEPGGTYQAGYSRGEPTTSGSYYFDPGSGVVAWIGGSYQENWPVAYYVEPNRYPDGSPRTGTGADRHAVALKVDQSSPLLPGQEVGSNPIYVYCYLEPA